MGYLWFRSYLFLSCGVISIGLSTIQNARVLNLGLWAVGFGAVCVGFRIQDRGSQNKGLSYDTNFIEFVWRRGGDHAGLLEILGMMAEDHRSRRLANARLKARTQRCIKTR